MASQNATSAPADLRDSEWVSQYFLRGSQPAFEQLEHRYAGLVFSICYKSLHDRQLAEDAKQTVFMILSQQALHLQPGLLKGYLAETAHRVAASHARERRRRLARERRAAAPEVQDLQPEGLASSDRQALVQRALTEIRSEDRELIQLRYFGKLKATRQLAESLGITHNAVKQRLSRAIRDLRRIAHRLETDELPDLAEEDVPHRS